MAQLRSKQTKKNPGTVMSLATGKMFVYLQNLQNAALADMLGWSTRMHHLANISANISESNQSDLN